MDDWNPITRQRQKYPEKPPTQPCHPTDVQQRGNKYSTMHDFIAFSYSFVFYASLYSSCESCSSSYSVALDFLIDLGCCVLQVAIENVPVHKRRLFRIDYFCI